MSQLISASGLGQPRRCYVDQGEPLQHGQPGLALG
jgi:hypothetical protein